MSFGSGSIPGYLQRLRNSKIRKATRQKKFKGGNDYSNVKSVKTNYKIPKIGGYDLAEIKKKIKADALYENKKQRLFWVLFIVVVMLLLLV